MGIWFLGMTLLGVLADFACSPGVLLFWLLGRKEWLACDAPGSHQVKAYLLTKDQGGEGIEYKMEGAPKSFLHLTFLRFCGRTPGELPWAILHHGFEQVLPRQLSTLGPWRASATRHLLPKALDDRRSFYVPQEVQLYQDFGCFHMPGESLTNITAEEMHRRLRGIQTSLGRHFF